MNHNLKTYGRPTQWYLAAKSTDALFFFMNADTGKMEVRGGASGWTKEDAWSFHTHLMGWDRQ